jgi:hypothetical protein
MTVAQVDEVIAAQNADRDDELRLFGEIAIEMGFIDESALQKYVEQKVKAD